jgi:hypothetical protein
MNTVEITLQSYDTDKSEKILIKRVKRNNLNKLIELQKVLLEDFIYFNAEVGSLIANNSSWKTIEKISSIIPVSPNGFLSDYLEALEDDLDTLTQLFFTQSWDSKESNYSDGFSFKPSLISKLNRLDYTGDLGKGILKAEKRKEQDMKEVMESLEKMKEGLAA